MQWISPMKRRKQKAYEGVPVQKIVNREKRILDEISRGPAPVWPRVGGRPPFEKGRMPCKQQVYATVDVAARMKQQFIQNGREARVVRCGSCGLIHVEVKA